MDGYDYQALREETRRQLEIARAQREVDRSLHEKGYEIWESALHALESDREREREVRHQEAWRLYVEAERREIRLRREGQLAKLLDGPLPGESREELERLAEEDRLRAIEGLVELMDENGQIIHRHIDDLTPEDWSARIRAEGVRIEWIAERRVRKLPTSPPQAGGA